MLKIYLKVSPEKSSVHLTFNKEGIYNWVCVCLQNNLKCYGQIVIKFSGIIHNGTLNKQMVKCLDPSCIQQLQF